MQTIQFAKIADDSIILSIGSFFRRQEGSHWGINLGFSPNQEKSALAVSNAPVLARKRVLNPTTEHKTAGYHRSFYIEDTQGWKIKKISNCPALRNVRKAESAQFCFQFVIDTDISVYLPQFELARALFFHNGYLSRTALESDCLRAEFDITIDDTLNEARISVLPSAGYPLKLYDNPGARRVLSWILLDPDARRSFESIGCYQKRFGTEYNGYRRWNFQFEPPSLPSAEFEVRGLFDPNSRSMFVYEITAIRNINVTMPEIVAIYHPRFREYVRGSGVGGYGSEVELPEHQVHDDASASSDNEHVLLQAQVVEFEFSSPFKTIKVADKIQIGSSGRIDDDAPGNVSVEESSSAGDLPSAEWDILSDITDDTHLYESKFECFQQMLAILVSEYGCSIKSKKIRKLPKLPRCKMHLLTTDGSPRCIAVVELIADGKYFHILEVDNSDAAKSLSTLLLRLNSPGNWQHQLQALEWELLKSSLRWPSHLLRSLCSRYNGVMHPKTEASDKGQLHPDAVAHWAERFYNWMKSM